MTSEQSAIFNEGCNLLENVLKSDTRNRIIQNLYKPQYFTKSLTRLREGMRSNYFKTDNETMSMDPLIRTLDTRTQEEGFHVLHDWDGKADTLNKETIPVDVLNFLLTTDENHSEVQTLAILLDYYFLYILVLLSVRVWDGDANSNIERLNELLDHLQGARGSGQQFVSNAETLLLIATSHFEPDERPYTYLLQKVKLLNRPHQVAIALAHASILGSHLRFGFEASYARDLAAMRNDNAPDYPWLCFALRTLLIEYSLMQEKGIYDQDRERTVEGIINGLTPDTRAFTNKPPASLEPYENERREVSHFLKEHREKLFKDFLNHRPSPLKYSPISFFFNFPHNILKGMVVHSLRNGTVSRLTLNDLFTGIPSDDSKLENSKREMALTLMGYARSSPDTIRGKPMPAVVYDPAAGHRFFVRALQLINKKALE